MLYPRSRLYTTKLPTIAIALVLAIVVFGVLDACSTSPSASTKKNPSTSTSSTKRHLKFVVVTNGHATDPFWSVVKHGVDQAATDMGVTVTYQTPDTFSIAAMSQLIDAAANTQPDGLVVSIPDCTGLSPAIKRAQLVGIPVISINSGSDCASKLALLNHVGQSEYQAGLAGGQKLLAAGAKHVLCINQDVGSADLDDRCRGVSDALKKAGKKSEVLAVDLSNSTVAQQKIQASLSQDSSINALIALSPSGTAPAIAALQQLGRQNQIMLTTFDLSDAVLQAIQQGSILFAIDQQQYLQGYLPIVLLTLYKTNANSVMNPVLMTGPSFVTKDNVTQVQQLLDIGTH